MKLSVKNLKEGFLDYPTHLKIALTVISIIIYTILDQFNTPELRVTSLIPLQIKPAMILIPIIAVFLGPLFGFSVGFFGSLASDIVNAHVIIAFGLTYVAIGLIGLLTGLPNYKKWENVSTDAPMLRLIIFSTIGVIVSIIVYLFALIFVAKQNTTITILYNLIPYIGQLLPTILIVSPVAVAIIDVLVEKE